MNVLKSENFSLPKLNFSFIYLLILRKNFIQENILNKFKLKKNIFFTHLFSFKNFYLFIFNDLLSKIFSFPMVYFTCINLKNSTLVIK